MAAYYNENDPDAAAVLRECIALDVIAPGVVDERSIRDVHSDDLRGFAQVHLFAGGGLWSVAARLAGWPDDRPLWTGSCPCQPYSAAGKRRGADDPRHLWPDFLRLLRGACTAGFGPPVVMGEQVSGKAGYGWFDGVRADLAAENYTGRARDIPACAVDAPHQRNRLFWIAVADIIGEQRQSTPIRGEWSDRRDADAGSGHARHLYGLLPDAEGQRGGREQPERRQEGRAAAWEPYATGSGVTQGDAVGARLEGLAGHGDGGAGRPDPSRPIAKADGGGGSGALAYCDGGGKLRRHAEEGGPEISGEGKVERPDGERVWLLDSGVDRPRGRNGSWWADAEWIICHDGKARRTKPGLRLLVDGLPGRVGLWRVGGNAISPILAAEVIRAFIEAEQEQRVAA